MHILNQVADIVHWTQGATVYVPFRINRRTRTKRVYGKNAITFAELGTFLVRNSNKNLN